MTLNQVFVKGVRLAVNPETQEEFTAIDVAALVAVTSKTSGKQYLAERKASFTTPLSKDIAEKLFLEGEIIDGVIERVALEKPQEVVLRTGKNAGKTVTVTHQNYYRFEA
jgi:hypothetical protein